MCRANVKWELSLVQLIIIMNLQHSRLYLHSHWSNSWNRSYPITAMSCTPLWAMSLLVLRATPFWMKVRWRPVLWYLLMLATPLWVGLAASWHTVFPLNVNPLCFSREKQCIAMLTTLWTSVDSRVYRGHVGEGKTSDSCNSTACWEWMNYWIVTDAFIASTSTGLKIYLFL